MSISDLKIVRRNILFLKGIYKKDCNSMEEMFTNQLMDKFKESDSNDRYVDVIYDTIPTTFTTVDKWVKSTNLKCWNCDCNFSNMPCFIPISLDPSKHGKEYTMDVYGNFCSFPCAASHINSNFRDDLWNKRMLLKILYSKFHGGKKIIEIPDAPSKTMMQQYGGTINVAEYRKMLTEITNSCHTDA